MSDSRTSWSACTISATRAARRSLSPKRISAVATVSFSLITGTQPQRRAACSASRGRSGSGGGPRCRPASAAVARRSGRARTAPRSRPAPGGSGRPRRRPAFPPAAAASGSGRASRRASAMAPEETTITSAPRARSAAMSAATLASQAVRGARLLRDRPPARCRS